MTACTKVVQSQDAEKSIIEPLALRHFTLSKGESTMAAKPWDHAGKAGRKMDSLELGLLAAGFIPRMAARSSE
jgi:hypothetical protein